MLVCILLLPHGDHKISYFFPPQQIIAGIISQITANHTKTISSRRDVGGLCSFPGLPLVSLAQPRAKGQPSCLGLGQTFSLRLCRLGRFFPPYPRDNTLKAFTRHPPILLGHGLVKKTAKKRGCAHATQPRGGKRIVCYSACSFSKSATSLACNSAGTSS